MVRLLLHELSDDLHILLLSQWLDVRSLVTLDVAVTSNISRPYWKALLGSLRSPSIDSMDHSASSLKWVIQRGVCPSRVQMKDYAWRVPGCDLSLLKTTGLLHLGLSYCSKVTDECILRAINGCRRKRWMVAFRRLWGCDKVAEGGIPALSAGCGQLQSIDLRGCYKVTDVGISALSAGCGQLQSIDLTCCKKVTDAGILALSAGCGQLQSINHRGCYKVTDAGISALSAGCGQLQSINLYGCDEVTDVGISALSAGCGKLQSIYLSYCYKVTDAGISALSAGCGKLQSINLIGCKKVTDAGISALSAGCGQLQSINLGGCG